MKSTRLAVLLVVMALLVVVRLAVPNAPASLAVVEPVARAVTVNAKAVGGGTAPTTTVNPPSQVIAAEDDLPGNAFAVPVIAPPPVEAPVAQPVVAAKPVKVEPQPTVAPMPVLPPPPPPFQVIGSYDDGGEKAVFLATPNSTVLARTGAQPMPDWKVTSITSQHVSLTQLSTQRDVQLPMPASP